jgi:hypothetical protein
MASTPLPGVDDEAHVDGVARGLEGGADHAVAREDG